MKSTVINISNEIENIAEILEETQRISAYADLDKKQALRLRLLAEELVGMLGELSGNFEGQFWAQAQDRKIELIANVFVMDEMDNKTKKGFIGVSSEKKNAAAKGIMGKIRDMVENMMYPENASHASNYFISQFCSDGMLGVDALSDLADQNGEANEEAVNVDNIVDGLMLSNGWSLNQYKTKQRDKDEAWDEIEKSIIANIADDVTVSVKGKKVEIKITKRF